MANLSAIKLPNNVTYDLKDNGALQLTGGQVTGPVTFGDSVSIDDLTAGQLVVTGEASFTNNIQANTINGVTVGTSPKFTDTDTKVTAVGNHYAPSTDSSAGLSVDASSSTSATWGSTSLVTGVNLQRDAKGHVTGITVDSIRMPANPNTTPVTSVNGKTGAVTLNASDVGALPSTTTVPTIQIVRW